ncbi:hypothetical protein D3C83_228310 [compost metagenome]
MRHIRLLDVPAGKKPAVGAARQQPAAIHLQKVRQDMRAGTVIQVKQMKPVVSEGGINGSVRV